MDNKKSSGQFELLSQKRFLPFFVTQFFGAFNDNVFKNALIILIAFQGAQFIETSADLLPVALASHSMISNDEPPAATVAMGTVSSPARRGARVKVRLAVRVTFMLTML